MGSYVARALARTFKDHGSKLRVCIVGRNLERAQEPLLQNGRETSVGSEWQFIPAADLFLIADVDRDCREITEQEKKEPFAGRPA